MSLQCPQNYTLAMQVFSPQRTHSLTWWPIKSKVQQPLLGFTVAFDINHWCPGSAVRSCPQDLSDHSFALPCETGLYINTVGGHLLDMRLLLSEKKRIFKQNSTGGLFNSAPQYTSGKWAKPASGLLFLEKGETTVLTLESPLFLFITGVRGPVIFTGRTADILISAAYVWLWCQLQPQFKKKRKKGCDTSGWYWQYLPYSSRCTLLFFLRDHLSERD